MGSRATLAVSGVSPAQSAGGSGSSVASCHRVVGHLESTGCKPKDDSPIWGVMTTLKGLRANAILSMATAYVAAMVFAVDVYKLIATHPMGDRRFRDIAYIPFFVSLMVVGIVRYRQFSSRITDDPSHSVDSK